MKKLGNLLQMCARAGKLLLGSEAVKRNLQYRNSGVIILAKDFSEKMKQRVRRECLKKPIKVFELGYKKDYGELFSRREVGVLMTNDINFAQGLTAAIEAEKKVLMEV